MLTVISVLVIISAMVVPRFTDIVPRMQVEGDAQQLAYKLRLARQEAITSGSYKIVIFYIDDNKYKYKNKTYYFNAGTTYVGPTSFNSFENGRPACIFLPSGSSTAAGTVTLKCGNKQKFIVVLNTTGRIRISD